MHKKFSYLRTKQAISCMHTKKSQGKLPYISTVQMGGLQLSIADNNHKTAYNTYTNLCMHVHWQWNIIMGLSKLRAQYIWPFYQKTVCCVVIYLTYAVPPAKSALLHLSTSSWSDTQALYYICSQTAAGFLNGMLAWFFYSHYVQFPPYMNLFYM